MTTETVWSRKFVTAAREQGVMARSLTGNGADQSSWPDKIFVGNEGTFLVEFKNVSTPLDPAQLSMLKKLAKRQPGRVFLARKKFDTGSEGKLYEPYTMLLVGEFSGPSDFWKELMTASPLAQQLVAVRVTSEAGPPSLTSK